MAKRKRKIKKLYKNLQKVCFEMSDYISELSEDQKHNDAEWKYLSDFIHYKKLDEEYIYFRENAHEEVDENMPFSRLTL